MDQIKRNRRAGSEQIERIPRRVKLDANQNSNARGRATQG